MSYSIVFNIDQQLDIQEKTSELDAIAIGLALTVAIMVIGFHSGGHFNPAVSVMLAMAGKHSMKELAPYVVAQVLGGLAALELYKRFKF